MKERVRKMLVWAKLHKKQLVYGLAGVGFASLVFQVFYPGDKLMPLASIDGQRFGGWSKTDAAVRLNQLYADDRIGVHIEEGRPAIITPTLSELGITVKNQERVNAINYPWYLRILPTSIVWAHIFQQPGDPQYASDQAVLTTYVTQHFGESCRIEPINANLEFKNNELNVVPAKDGGTCKREDVDQKLKAVRGTLTREDTVLVPVTIIKPTITDDQATEFKTQLEARAKDGLGITVGGDTHVVSRNDALSWLTFKNETSLDIGFDTAKAAEYFNQHITPKVAKPAGVSKVTTHDFVETARVNGAAGQTLDIPATLGGMRDFLLNKADAIIAKVAVLPPKVEYTRTYSPTDTGLSALIKHYAEDHPGTFGISLIELSGKHRRADYQSDKAFTTASTYKLFVAYSSLKRVEAGVWQWSDPIQGGRNLERCFDDMIVKSDNACAEAMLQKIGFREITSEIQALGLKNSTFLKGDMPQTTAGDLSNFMAILNAGQMLSQQSSRDRLLDAMKRNIYRKGIPVGASGQVADKVGFLNGLFHDVAIVYSPAGTYALTIMSDGSSWDAIADLTRKIEALRAQ
jgi:beta-lactamase class A